ncbi:uncharacterized protein SCDLUD_004047 [Saccharomycodes ludwigii]|uniref:uncharacterized protein n=1 Tax=Saccharomycodes ludwigii TaxID=36035 RepID=UPI001E8518F8|nr:hypothetical protein SCDLUD_004047 [Saccharomycodes ludwigii]KAH3899759.1 hypothetical protein SCDLUD_004047 [Saccharomycodes ludwigii]
MTIINQGTPFNPNNETVVLEKAKLATSQEAFSVHLVPCLIDYNGPTQELPGNFDKEVVKDGEIAYEARYLRGHKIIGKKVQMKWNFQPFLIDICQVSGEDEDLGSDTAQCQNIKILGQCREIVNYEREGNESRLNEEMTKFEEYLELMNNVIME